MKKRFLSLLLAGTLLCTLLAIESNASENYKTWSQSDPRWANTIMGTTDNGTSITLAQNGSLIISLAKMLVHSGQQNENNFTPANCLSYLKATGMMSSSGGVIFSNYNNTFLPTYAPNLKKETTPQHSAWSATDAYNQVKNYLDNNYYVILCVQTRNNGNLHYMTVDYISDGKIYVMDNGQIVSLYDTPNYSLGVVDQIIFKYSSSSTSTGSTAYKTWSQNDSRWSGVVTGIRNDGSNNTIGKTGCYIVAIAKILIHAGQQTESSFSPDKCYSYLKSTNMIGNDGIRGANFNNSFLPKYGPQLKKEYTPAHSAWSSSTGYSKVKGYIDAGYYVIVCVNNKSTGNTHYMAVDYASNGKVYVMDNNQVVSLYDTYSYSGGIIDQIIFKYSGGKAYPAHNNQVSSPEKPNVSIASSDSESVTTISWNDSKGATSYDISIYDKSGAIVDKNTGIKSISYNVVLPKGDYTVNVTSVNSVGRAVSNTQRFSVADAYRIPTGFTIVSSTATSAVLTEIDGCEYSVDNIHWVDDPIFLNLNRVFSYNFYARYKETDLHSASDSVVYTLPRIIYNNDIHLNVASNINVKAGDIVNVKLSYTSSNYYIGGIDAYLYFDPTELSLVYPDRPTLVTGEFIRSGYDCARLTKIFMNEKNNDDFETIEFIAQKDISEAPHLDFYVDCLLDPQSEQFEPDCFIIDYSTLYKEQNAPGNLSLESKSCTSITVKNIPNCEYSIDGETWQISNTFNNLEPNTTYSIFARFSANNEFEASSKNQGVQITTSAKAECYIKGMPQYGNTLTAVAADFPTDAVLHYQWKLDDTNVGKDSATYIIYAAAIGKSLTVTISDEEGHSATSDAVIPTKVSQNAPDKPVLLTKTDTSVALKATSGREFSCDGINWQTSNIFEGLMQNTEYRFYARMKGSAGYETSSASPMLTVFTEKTSAPIAVTLSNTAVYATAVTATIEGAPEGATISYQWYVDGSPVGKNLNSYTVYSATFGKTIYCDVTINGTQTVRSGGYICKPSQKTAPAAPELIGRTHNSISVKTVAGCEYSIDGKTWQPTGEFTDLTQGMVYSIYTRRPASDNYLASIARKLKVITAVDESDFNVEISGTGAYNTALTATVSGIDTAGKTVTYQWQRGDAAVGGNSSKYTCYIADIGNDVTVTVMIDGKVAVSNAVVGTKGVNRVSVAPTLKSKTANSITLNEFAGCEFSLDGINWQTSNIISGLTSGNQYNIYMRRKASRAYKAGSASNALRVSL